jgi:hypothetical protein
MGPLPPTTGPIKEPNVTAESCIDADGICHTAWKPLMLRKRSLGLLIAANALILATVAALHISSTLNSGLGKDEDSKGIFFASRFLPTAVAVIYMIFVSIMLDEVKRTENLARLSRPNGAPASISLLYVPGAWWNAFAQSLPDRQQSRDFSTALFCASSAFILGFAILSPASSVLFASTDVVLQAEEPFMHISVTPESLLQLPRTDEIYFRTLGNLVQNAKTSPWVTDSFAVVPFWPERFVDDPVQSSFLAPSTETWESNATVFSAEILCESMKVEEVRMVYNNRISFANETEVEQWPTVEFSSLAGCNVTEINIWEEHISWTNSTNTATFVFDDYDYGRNCSDCGNNETFIHTTALANANYSGGETVMTLRDDVRIQAYTCETH